ncbi:MAG: porin family protein [Bacteroidota bacterium]
MRKIVFTLIAMMFLIVSSTTVRAQRIIVKNQEKYDKQWIHFGFLLGTNKTNFKVSRTENFLKNDSVLFLSADGQTGFDLGIISNLRIAENFDLRFTPMLAFSQRDINYRMTLKVAGSTTVTKKIESTFIQFPLLLKFKSNRVNNYRFYVLGGAKYMIDLVSQAAVENDQQLVKLKKYDYGYEIGLGMDLYLPLFKFAPEIKMYQGIPNILGNDNAVYTTSLNGLKSRIWSVSFTFE